MKKKLPKSKTIFFISIFIFSLIFIIGVVLPIAGFNPYSTTGEGKTYILANDILKNFKFESIDGEPIINEGAFGNKLRFDRQAEWILYKDDVIQVGDPIEVGDSTHLRYRITLRNKLNFYTNCRLNDLAQSLDPISEEFLAGTYIHYNLGQTSYYRWDEYITWDYWDFGDIVNYNLQNNYFNGRVVMSFDIDPDPIPDVFGEGASKEFDHIAVYSAGISNNIWGSMSTDMPDIVVLTPSDYETARKDKYTTAYTGDNVGTMESDFMVHYNPLTTLTVTDTPIKSFDSSIFPDTVGSSLDPKNKDGTPLWDPEVEEKSMTDCLLHYDIQSLSPVVYEYGAQLTWWKQFIKTEDVLGAWFQVVTIMRENTDSLQNRYHSIALHGINRYIQTDIYVSFDIWTSVKLGTLTDYYAQMQLQAPTEYYDALIWSTIAGGWSGSKQESAPVDPIGEWIDAIDEFFDEYLGLILMIVIVVGGIILFIYVGVPIIKGRQRRKEIETIMKKR